MMLEKRDLKISLESSLSRTRDILRSVEFGISNNKNNRGVLDALVRIKDELIQNIKTDLIFAKRMGIDLEKESEI